MKRICPLIFTAFITITNLGCNQLSGYSGDNKVFTSNTSDGAISCSPENGVLDLKGIRTSHPRGPSKQREFHIIMEGFQIIPMSGLRSLALFTPNLDSAMVMGDIITGEKNLALVEREVAAVGLTITDIHRFGARDRTVILFMHIKGFGNKSALSRNVDALVSKLTVMGESDRKKSARTADLNTAKLDSMLGYEGDRLGEIYQYNIDRENALEARGMHGRSIANFNTWAAWQGTDEEAVVAGDVTMLANEVEPVIKALAESGFELVHNQIVHENPKLFCLHYWAVGNAANLANGFRAALDKQQ